VTILVLPSGSVDEWLDTLPAYQAALLVELGGREEPAAAAARWLESAGPSNTAPLGALKTGGDLFFLNLLRQLRTLLCATADATLESERAAVVRQAALGRTATVTAVAGLLGPLLGVAPVLIAPALALVLAVLSQVGQATMCDVLSSLISAREAERSDS